MIDMFTNYQNLASSYIPNNLDNHLSTPCSYTKLNPCEMTKPYELYDAKGELEGYYWYYGNTINLDFTIDGEILDIHGNNTGNYIDASAYLLNKTATLTLYNFRMEAIYQESTSASSNIIFSLDKELSAKMLRGIYYCSLEVSDAQSHETIFNASDCKFLVK